MSSGRTTGELIVKPNARYSIAAALHSAAHTRALGLSDKIASADGFVTADVDGETLALHVDKGSCYALNRVASRVWELTSRPIRISDLCEVLISEYAVARDTCERQVLDLLEELKAEGMVRHVQEETSA
jgi:Coenzyme PQQ synthesis protein D (PqqD)